MLLSLSFGSNVDVNVVLRIVMDRPPSSYGSMHSDDHEEEIDDFDVSPLKQTTRYTNIQKHTHKSIGVSFY